MGVEIFSGEVTLNKCHPTDLKTWNIDSVYASVTNTNLIKRSLFGPVDHNETMTYFQKELAQMGEEKKLKWNFDFVNEKPLVGSYKWEKVDNAKSCKSRSPHKVTKSKAKRSPLKSKVNRDNLDVRTKQTSITDYLDISKSTSVKQRTVKESLSI